jgi:hypothetical protein
VSDESAETDLERELSRAIARIDPVPAPLVEAASGALAWRTIDADLAELVFDSLTDSAGAALVRGGDQARMLTFQAGGRTIDLEVTGSAGSRELVGQLTPPGPARVEIRQGALARRADADDLGRFTAGGLQAGPVSLRCQATGAPGGSPVVTDWVTI